MTTSAPSRATAAARPSRGAAPEAVLGALATGAAAVAVVWWHHQPRLGNPGDALTNAGRLAGLYAGYGVAVLLALMARMPWLERGVGADRLARWHARVGRVTVCLVVAHGLLILWGYAVTAHTGLVTQGRVLLLSYPDVLMATVAGLLLVGVGVISVRAARRRMRYETWYYLHLYTYLAAALAFSHQFATGADFQNDLTARIWWGGMYAGVAAAVLWWRFVMPLRTALRQDLRVESVRVEGPGVVSVVLKGPRVARLRAQPGQFFRWRFLTPGMWWASHPYSLSAPPKGNRLRITVKSSGDHSGRLAHLRPGVRVIAEGPYGAMTAARRRRRKVLLIAGGLGIAPLRALFETLPARPGELTLLYRAGSRADVVLRDELHAIAARRGARLRVVVGHREELGTDPLSTGLLQETCPDLHEHDVFVCGPPAMTAATIETLRVAGVPARRIHHESFAF